MLGGGNADKIDNLPRKVRLGDNAYAFEGGFRLWKKGRSNSPAHADKRAERLARMIEAACGGR